MKTEALRTEVVKIEIPDRVLAHSLLETWAFDSRVAIRCLRGRLTPDSARLELELRGKPRDVENLLRCLDSWNPSPGVPAAMAAGA